MSVVTKNPFAYLGNDSDGEEKPVVPVKTVDKATTRTTKRNVEPQAPLRPAGAGNNRRGPGGNEGAFRDRGAGSERNQGRSTEDAPRGDRRGGYGARVRGGRGSRHPRDRDDRHPSRANAHGSDKQAAQSGATEGNAELKDEQAGEAIAQSEQADAGAEATEEPAEPEEKHVSYEEYLAQQLEKKASLGDSLSIREANEGSKLDKKWASAVEVKNEEVDYFAPAAGKAQRQRERKVKQTVDFDPRFVESDRPRAPRGGRGGRGGARGGARGGERGRGDRGRGAPRGAPRGGREAAAINTSDQSAFPSLGGN